jgi:hypothetical protein
VLALVLALLFGYVATHRYPAQPPPRPAPAPAPPLPGGAAVAEPYLTGRTGAGPAGLRLLVDGTDPRIVDTHTLRVTPVPGLDLKPGLTAQLLQVSPSMVAALIPLYGPNGGVYLIRPGARPLLLGDEGLVIPSDGGILVAVYRPGGTSVTGLTLDRHVRWQWHMPGNLLMLRDTPAGLLAARYGDAVVGDADLLLLDRRTGVVRRRLGHGRYAVAASDRALAWVPERCDPGCAVVVTDLATGAIRRHPLSQPWSPAVGAFAPDGRSLALSFSGTTGDQQRPAQSGFVEILDLRTDEAAAVAGLSTPPDEHADTAWSPDGRWLVLGVKYASQERIALLRPGDSELTILPVALAGQPITATLATLR